MGRQSRVQETWEGMSRDSYRAGKILMDKGCWRSSVSRFYYAAYSASASYLLEKRKLRRVAFSHQWKNPSHGDVEALLRMYTKDIFRKPVREQLIQAFSRLLKARVDADYRKHEDIGMEKASKASHDAGLVINLLLEVK